MMKIHTTQDLSTLVQSSKSTNTVSSEEFRFVKEKPNLRSSLPDSYTSSLTFGKGVPPKPKKVFKKIEDTLVGNIKDKPTPEVEKGDKFLDSKFFEVMLDLAENEPVVQAAMSAFICIGLRPVTIMALPNKKGKDDNKYAASHAICSGAVGIVSALIITQPFKMGQSYMKKNMYKDLSVETLKRLHPHLDVNSIKDASGNVQPMSKWLDIKGNQFSLELKDVDKIPMLKSFNNISAESFKAFGADVDWAAQKGKSFNEVVTRDGKSLYDAIDWTRVGFIIEQDGMGDARVLIRDLNKDFFKEVIADAEENSQWKKLDLNSVFDSNNKVQDFRKWKGTDGKQWKLDLDQCYLSSVYDTANYVPRITGKTRKEAKGEIKYVTYQKNGHNGDLGTEITQEMVDSEKRNEIHSKIVTWLPDIATRPFVATATIALIPLVLSKVFHMEKPKKQEAVAAPATVSFKGKNDSDNNAADNGDEISFKKGKPKGSGKKLNFWERFIAKPLAKIYGKPLYDSEWVSNLSDRLKNVPGKMTAHMATLGSLITSSVYMQQTLTKKDLEPDRRRTLAINQGLCFIIPTVIAYWVDNKIENWIKSKEYRYSGRRQFDIAQAELAHKNVEHIEKMKESLGKRLKGVRILAGLATFSLIYRYVTPVIITPIATLIGDKVNAKKRAKAAAAAEAAAQNA